MSNQSEAVALAYLDAVGKKELDRIAALIDPDIRFVLPERTISGALDVLAAFRRIGAIHVRNDILRVFSDGDEVCVIYDFVTDTVGVVPTIEWLTITGGRIRMVKLYYDRVPWMTLREELARRANEATA
jgi:hypothetical protein